MDPENGEHEYYIEKNCAWCVKEPKRRGRKKNWREAEHTRREKKRPGNLHNKKKKRAPAIQLKVPFLSYKIDHGRELHLFSTTQKLHLHAHVYAQPRQPR